jgi:phospholipase/carboxylesterase
MAGDGYVYRERRRSGAAAPLLFLFHGTGGDEDQLFELGEHLLPEAHLIAPRGDVSEHGALRFFRRTGEGVYDMDDLAARTAKMADFVAARLGAVRPPRVLGLGYSNGANILASVLMARPELFNRAVLMHPLIPFAPPPQPGLAGRRVLITAGRRDPIAPASQTEALADYFRRQGAAVETHWHEGGHAPLPEEIAAAKVMLAG